MTRTTQIALQDLTYIVVSWEALRAHLTTTTPTTWPPVMGIAHLERDEKQLAEAAAERAERTATAPGERPAPLRVPVLDVITRLDEALCSLADEIASAIQRPAFTVRAASPADTVARSVALMGAKDAADPRRWRWNMAAERTGAVAAAWLADRLTTTDGPFRPLTPAHEQRIAATAAACRRRLDRTLGEPTVADDQAVDLQRQCACGGELLLSREPDDFRITCDGCGTSWSGAALLNSINAA